MWQIYNFLSVTKAWLCIFMSFFYFCVSCVSCLFLLTKFQKFLEPFCTSIVHCYSIKPSFPRITPLMTKKTVNKSLNLDLFLELFLKSRDPRASSLHWLFWLGIVQNWTAQSHYLITAPCLILVNCNKQWVELIVTQMSWVFTCYFFFLCRLSFTVL